MKIDEFLQLAVQKNASDLHLTTGLPPFLRINGDLQITDLPALNKETLENLFLDILTPVQQGTYKCEQQLDLVYSQTLLGNFRINLFRHDRGMAAAIRLIPERIKSIDELELPTMLKQIGLQSQGLVLLTGATGSGKTTTLAAMIEHMNQNSAQHIITIEDPIEYKHVSKNCLINQREVKRDTLSFNSALSAVLREDPDVILVGEMRTLKAIRMALTAAETGHLVLTTLHTMSAAKAITRIIDVFPGDEKNHVRQMLAESIKAVICQTLCKKTGGGRIAAVEILLATNAVQNLIRENKIQQIYSVLQTGMEAGMQTLDQHLLELVKRNLISYETAKEHAIYKEQFDSFNN
jgi:twitching motility protein PilT